MQNNNPKEELLTFGGHLEVLRLMLFRILIVVVLFSVVIFCFKRETFEILLAPSEYTFSTFSAIEKVLNYVGWQFHFEPYHIDLISTELSAQFMTHISTSFILGLLLASPYMLYELFKFISPALYENERKYSTKVVGIIFLLFISGVLMTYFLLFPISFQFLANYQVNERVVNTITLESYISTFTTLTFLMGIVFQLPVITYFLGRIGLMDANLLKQYRPYAFVLIMVIAAIITPPDIMTLILVTIPLYGLYELSILVLNKFCKIEEEGDGLALSED
ncbi:MAG: twin-arginine translocase subunit TatC [Muribaculaceae bacterium]|nr:twin-arginine translocase subunit TatC [Muribaculaceae bacterium]